MLYEFQVGKPFPWELFPGKNVVCATNMGNFIDIIIPFNHLTPLEKTAFFKHPLSIFLYTFQQVPFIILDFGVFSIDVFIDINKIVSLANREAWLNIKSNTMSIILIEGTTNTVVGIGAVDINFAQDLRNILKQQPTDSKLLENIASDIVRQYPTSALKEHARKKFTTRLIQMESLTYI